MSPLTLQFSMRPGQKSETSEESMRSSTFWIMPPSAKAWVELMTMTETSGSSLAVKAVLSLELRSS